MESMIESEAKGKGQVNKTIGIAQARLSVLRQHHVIVCASTGIVRAA